MLYLKRILSIICFLCGLAVLLIITSYVFTPKNNMSGGGMEEVAANGILGEKENTVDVLVIGDSESYSAITPMQLWKEEGYTSYVCGTKAQSLDYSMIMLRRAFQKQNPRVVILETNAIYREISESNITINRLGNCFSVFLYHDRWKKLQWNDLMWKTEFTWTDDYKGYIYSNAVDASKQTDYMKASETAAEISDLNIQYVQKIKDFCDEHGAALILLSTPSTKNWNYERHNGICTLAEELGCAYVDLNLMNEQLQIDWAKDTRDKGDHMNYSGAKKVTHFLAVYLKETGILTDHREDEDYTAWNEALKRYEMLVSAAGA